VKNGKVDATCDSILHFTTKLPIRRISSGTPYIAVALQRIAPGFGLRPQDAPRLGSWTIAQWVQSWEN